MAAKKYFNTEVKNAKWIKEGRGAGHGENYLPWLTVRDLASRGRSQRIFGHKSLRTHHLLSDLELAVFLILEWRTETLDIREQFPLRLEDTRTLAKEAGLKHPQVQDIDQIMSSDFLVDTSDPSCPKFSLQAKYAKDLQDARTVEKLELERRYWQSKSVPWKIVTEKEIPPIVFQNINWLYPAQGDEIDDNILVERIDFYQHMMKENSNQKIIDVARKLDMAYSMEMGESLLELRQLMAKRYFKFDIFTPFKKLKASDLTIGNVKLIQEVISVSNQ
ncbi:TnsA endonuclease C-terminal domain-containing protein [Thalassomonas sp. RHCl1]|uniref:TnsA endonuclease C-terminal domain-containing protein n=1 Tax=Thalassomonas sp. RHCl1 TaxID=2995320 RepID=UPI00248BA3FB|nr:TnsA endonuclease C-terminal domain-containing protein [Thalassomonas sp. RHCl1]